MTHSESKKYTQENYQPHRGRIFISMGVSPCIKCKAEVVLAGFSRQSRKS